MSALEFEFEGLDELERDLRDAIDMYPDEMRKELRKVAKDFKKSVLEKTPDGEHHRGDPKKKLRKKFGIRTRKDGDQHIALVYNSAPHFHLVERGHVVVRKGRAVGFAPGKHMMERTQNEYEDIVPERFRQICDEVLRGHGL